MLVGGDLSRNCAELEMAGSALTSVKAPGEG